MPPFTELHDHSLVRSGALILQDKASCLAPAALAPRPGELVLDCCAAPGNKTTQLAALAAPGGRVIACERDARRAGVLHAVRPREPRQEGARGGSGGRREAKGEGIEIRSKVRVPGVELQDEQPGARPGGGQAADRGGSRAQGPRRGAEAGSGGGAAPRQGRGARSNLGDYPFGWRGG